jgi:hypothetical protein
MYIYGHKGYIRRFCTKKCGAYIAKSFAKNDVFCAMCKTKFSVRKSSSRSFFLIFSTRDTRNVRFPWNLHAHKECWDAHATFCLHFFYILNTYFCGRSICTQDQNWMSRSICMAIWKIQFYICIWKIVCFLEQSGRFNSTSFNRYTCKSWFIRAKTSKAL